MFRRIISNGDLVVTHQPWYCVLTGKWKPYRNLSEEVRYLGDQMDQARSKYNELRRWYAVATKNVGDDLETLQILKMDNSEAFFETTDDQSILDMREGIKYNLGGDKKQGQASPNKDKQQQDKQQQNKDRRKSKSLLSLLANAEVSVH